MPEAFAGVPAALWVLAIGGLLLGLPPLWWILRRGGRFILRRPQVPVGFSRYLMALATSGFLLGVAGLALGLAFAMRTWHAFTEKQRIAEIRCTQAQPGKLRLDYTPIDRLGRPQQVQSFNLDGDEWTVGGDVLRFKDFLTPLGLHTVQRVSRVEGRWSSAEQARAHLPTAYDLDGGATASWMALYREGTWGPLSLLVAGVHGQAVSQVPDDKATFDLLVTPNGYILDKHP